MPRDLPEIHLSGRPDRMLAIEAGLDARICDLIARYAVQTAQQLAPKMSGSSAASLEPVSSEGIYGIYFPSPVLWYQDHGTRPFTMRSLEGKAQPLDEPILTPGGWINMGDVKVGQYVIGSNGYPTKVLGIYPQGVLDCYEITFSDGTSVRCSADHLWTVYRDGNDTRYSNTLRTKTTEELMRPKNPSVWSIPLVRPVSGKRVPLDIDPYLLGIFISEGCRDSSPTFSQDQQLVVDEVAKVIPDGVELVRSGIRSWSLRAGRQGTTWNPVARTLRELGLSHAVDNSDDTRVCPICGSGGSRRGPYTSSRAVYIHMNKAHGVATPRKKKTYGIYSYEKFIPDVLKRSSIEQRTSLLQGLMDGDGSCPLEGGVKYHTSSEKLALDVVELARGLGGFATARKAKRPSRPEDRTMYVVTMSFPDAIMPFRAPLELKKVRYDDRKVSSSPMRKTIKSISKVSEARMQCIRVEAQDSLYVTSGYNLTHNTIPMWLDDPSGTLRAKNPKAKTRTTASGRFQVLVFRKAARKGQQRTKMVKNRETGQMVPKLVAASYPGAPGRINQREAGSPNTTPGRVAGAIAPGNGGVRWRHPGLTPRLFMGYSIHQAALHYGVSPLRLYIADGATNMRPYLR